MTFFRRLGLSFSRSGNELGLLLMDREDEWEWFSDAWPVGRNWTKNRLPLTVSKGHRVLGLIVLDRRDAPNRSLRVAGFLVLPSSRGKGYGTRIFKAVSAWAFSELNVHRIYAATLETNRAMQAVFRKAGFVQEGREREAVFRHGRYVDRILFSLLERRRSSYK